MLLRGLVFRDVGSYQNRDLVHFLDILDSLLLCIFHSSWFSDFKNSVYKNSIKLGKISVLIKLCR